MYGANGLAATIVPRVGTRYITADHLGTPRIITATNGVVVSRHDYQPFGEELFAGMGGRSTTQGYSNPADSLRQKFTGYERDSETGLDFALARYYANGQGRFTSPDPFQGSGRPLRPQSWNRYAYVLNNPLRFVDPTGMADEPSDPPPPPPQQSQQQQQPQQQNYDAARNNGNADDISTDQQLEQFFTDDSGIVRGASSVRPSGVDSHYELADGTIHTIHIYGDETANEIVGVYIPADFSNIDYVGGGQGSVVATNPTTGEVIRASHIQVGSQAELNKNSKDTNAAGSRYIGDIGGKGGSTPGNIHAHLTMFKNGESMKKAMEYKYQKGGMGEYGSKVGQHMGNFRTLVNK